MNPKKLQQTIKWVDIKKLKPDKTQPRKEIEQDLIDKMSISLKNEGIINPIEIDKNYVIITGEIRWRSAKHLNWEKVPCKIIEISDKRRFLRQVHENIHHNSMTTWDTAKALDKSIIILTVAATIKSWGGYRHGKEGCSVLAEEFGLNRHTIGEYLEILDEEKAIQELSKKKGFKRTLISEVKKAPEIYQKKIKKMLIEKPEIKRDTMRQVYKHLQRAEAENETEKGWDVLNLDFSNKGLIESNNMIEKVYPSGLKILRDAEIRTNKIVKTITELIDELKENPLHSFPKIDQQHLRTQFGFLVSIVKDYLSNKEVIEYKQFSNIDTPKKLTTPQG